MKVKKPFGFLVVEHCEEFEQPLTLKFGDGESIPIHGILDWCEKGGAVAIFESRKQAQAAITRTEHYRLAFQIPGIPLPVPERKFCKIIPAFTLAIPAPTQQP